MGYQIARTRRYANTEAVDVSPAAPVLVTANGTSYELGDRAVARFSLVVTAVAGTNPTLDVTLQTSPDGTTWSTAGTFTQSTAASTERKVFAVDRFIRPVFTVGGTGSPSFTFTLSGEAA